MDRSKRRVGKRLTQCSFFENEHRNDTSFLFGRRSKRDMAYFSGSTNEKNNQTSDGYQFHKFVPTISKARWIDPFKNRQQFHVYLHLRNGKSKQFRR